MGECARSPQFTHVAYDDFRVVRVNLAGRPRTTRDRLIPYCMLIDPELGRVGLGRRRRSEAGLRSDWRACPWTRSFVPERSARRAAL
jgi:pyruvate/2-oxoglutarate dehydrogenase complex dihydrolipoamide dehydrogenase (E3) component